MRRLIRDISSVLIISGLLLVIDAGVTLIWQEPVTAVVAMIKQGQINKRYLSFRTTPLTPVERHALVSLKTLEQRMSFLARREARQVGPGDAIGRIMISKIGVSYDVVQGTDDASLQKGPGHYPSTALPGLGQTIAIAGHRTTYLAPFRHIDALKRGDRIVLQMPYGRFTYAVQWHLIVAPTALWITHNVGYERLVLSACNPLYSAAQRIVVFARLSAVVPEGAARPA
ncbi:MAG: class E sortase [Solirubrobacterales bacterium]|nr:class E sortase [Solirubrobacterales bacterium]MBV9796503.1 class E sortase [Solirubrobacterales bacterium]